MKIDAMSAGAIAFAAFAAYAYLKPKAPAKIAATGALDMLAKQRQEVGSALWQNEDWLTGAGFSEATIQDLTMPAFYVPRLGI